MAEEYSIEELRAIAGPPEGGSTEDLSIDELKSIAGPPETPRTLKGTAENFFSQVLGGFTDLTGAVESIFNVVSPSAITQKLVGEKLGVPKSTETAKDQLTGVFDFLAGPNSTTTGADTLEGRIGRFAPSAVISPGGVIAKTAQAVLPGSAGWAVKELGAGPTGQAAAEIAASFLPAGIQAASSKLISTGDNIIPLSAQEQALADLNITRGQISKANKYKNIGPLDEPSLVQASKGASTRGVFDKLPTGEIATPEVMLARNEQALNELNLAANNVLDVADAALPGLANPPAFDAAKQFIKSKGADDTLEAVFNKRMAYITKEYDGSLASLNRAKQGLQGAGYTGADTNNARTLDRIMSGELREAIETQANAVKPGLGDAIADLNAQQAEHITLKPVLEAAKNKIVSEDLRGGPQAKWTDIFRPNNAAKATLLGKAGLNALAGNIPGAVKDVAAYGVIKALETDPGRHVVGNVLKGAGKVAAPFGAGVSSSAPAIVEALQPKQPTYLAMGDNPRSEARIEETKQRDAAKIPESVIIAEIESDPVDAAIFQVESSSGKNLRNPESTAKGAFQLIDSTAKSLGVNKVMDLAENFQGYKKLKADHIEKFGDDPDLIYAAHVLGATRLKRLQKNQLTDEDKPIVNKFIKVELPRFQAALKAKLAKQAEGAQLAQLLSEAGIG